MSEVRAPGSAIDRSQQAASSRPLLKDQAYREIKSRILDERFTPGSFLAERWLAHELGMSKTPVRAAIGRLEVEGYVAVSPQQGIVVRETSFQEIVDHFDTRLAIEPYVVGQLAGQLTAAHRARLRDNLDRQHAAATAAEISRYVQLDTAFHLLVAAALDNREIVLIMTRQCEKLYRVISRVFRQDPKRLVASHREHQELYLALEAGDAQRAAQLVRRHLEFGKRYLIAT